jgi:Zinc knuckle
MDLVIYTHIKNRLIMMIEKIIIKQKIPFQQLDRKTFPTLNKTNGPDKTTTTCTNCGHRGHISKDCFTVKHIFITNTEPNPTKEKKPKAVNCRTLEEQNDLT